MCCVDEKVEKEIKTHQIQNSYNTPTNKKDKQYPLTNNNNNRKNHTHKKKKTEL